MNYLEIYIQSEGEVKKIKIKTESESIECDVQLIEGCRYEITSNIEKAIELTQKNFQIEITEYGNIE
jgi:hypothetical protein